MERISAKVAEIGFFKLKRDYRTDVTDLPTTFVIVTRGTESKKAEDYFGAPKRLHDLKERIEQIVKP